MKTLKHSTTSCRRGICLTLTPSWPLPHSNTNLKSATNYLSPKSTFISKIYKSTGPRPLFLRKNPRISFCSPVSCMRLHLTFMEQPRLKLRSIHITRKQSSKESNILISLSCRILRKSLISPLLKVQQSEDRTNFLCSRPLI